MKHFSKKSTNCFTSKTDIFKLESKHTIFVIIRVRMLQNKLFDRFLWFCVKNGLDNDVFRHRILNIIFRNFDILHCTTKTHSFH